MVKKNKEMRKKQNIERCCICDSPTEKAGIGEDSLYGEEGDGPYCEECYEWKYGNTSKKGE